MRPQTLAEAVERIEKREPQDAMLVGRVPHWVCDPARRLDHPWFTAADPSDAMDDALLEKVADGRVFTGRQAVELKLVDQLGDEKAAVAWLVVEKKVKSDLPVRDYKLTPRFGDLTFLRTAASITFDALGLSSIARQIEQGGVAQAVDQLSLDGMLALWRPAASN